MKDLIAKFPRLNTLARTQKDIGFAVEKTIDLFGEKKRHSKRFVLEHCFETAELTTKYSLNPTHIISALFHDVKEDLGLNSSELKSICGKSNQRIAEIVDTLSKNKEITNWEKRSLEYHGRIYQAVASGDYWVGVLKIMDRLSNLNDLDALAPRKRVLIAFQTVNFFTTLANQMNLPILASKLTSLSFFHLDQVPERRVVHEK